MLPAALGRMAALQGLWDYECGLKMVAPELGALII
jgi:hypothetical protein